MAATLLDAPADSGSTFFPSGGGSFSVSAGTDRVLYYVTFFEGPAADLTGVDYGDQAMTEVSEVVTATGNDLRVQVWALNDAGIDAAVDTNFDLAGTNDSSFRSLAFSVQDADQSLTIQDSASSTAQGGGASLDVDAVADGYVIGVSGMATPGDVTWSGLTEQLELDDSAMTRSVAFSGSTSAGALSITGTNSNSSGAQVRLALAFAEEVAVGGAASASAAIASTSTCTADATQLSEEPGLDNGLRRIFVSKDGNNSNDGLSAVNAKLTIQAGLDLLQAGDVLTIGSGVYFETPSLTGVAGTVDDNIWIVAERRGEVTISHLWEDAYNGTQVWDDEGGGTWSAVHGDVWSGFHGGDFLFRYQSQADLEAATLSVNGIVSNPNVITKPQYGFAVEGGRIYVKLRDGIDPNGEQIKLTENFSATILDFNNCDNFIVDGLRVEGAGNTPAIEFDGNCANPILRNTVSDLSRGLVRHSSDALVEWCEYTYSGFEDWMVELLTLDGPANLGVFDINKNYNVDNGNTYYEGGMAFGTSGVDANVEHRFNYIHGVFDGMRAGAFDNLLCHDNTFRGIGDNCIECESFRASDLSANMQIYHNYMERCHDGFISHQSSSDSDATGPCRVYRNVLIADDSILSRPAFLLKMINTDLAVNFDNIDYYHNLFKNIRGNNNEASPTDFNGLWADHFSSFDADEITLFANNVAIFEDGLDSGGGPDPQGIADNCLAAPSDNATYQGGGGFRVANEAALLLGSNFELLTGSPLIGAGGALSASLPDVETGANKNDDIGPFPDGFNPGANWPRIQATTFERSVPGTFATVTAAAAMLFGVTANAITLRGASAQTDIISAVTANAGLQAAASATAALLSGVSADALRLALVSASTDIVSTSAANAQPSVGVQGVGALTFGASATAVPPVALAPVEPLADGFLNSQAPIVLIDLFFDSGSLHIWTLPFPRSFEGNDYVPLAGITAGITVRNSLDVSSLDAGLQLSGQSEELLNIALTEQFQGREAVIRLGNLDDDLQIKNTETIFLGSITNMPVTDTTDDSTVAIVLDSIFKDLQSPRVVRQSPADHALRDPDDSIFDFVETTEVNTQEFGGV